MAKIIGIVILYMMAFYLSAGLCQALEQNLAEQDDFPLKNLIMLLVPAPEDNILEMIQFLTYWAVGVFATFRIKD